jgi:hypothetical protein
LRRSPSPVQRSLLTKAMQLPIKAILALMRPRVAIARADAGPPPSTPEVPRGPEVSASPDVSATESVRSHGTG